MTEGFLYEKFWYSETKQFPRSTVILDPSFIRKKFRFPKVEKDQSVPLLVFSARWDKKFRRKILKITPLPLPLSIKIFDIGKFPKPQHRKVLLRSFSLLWDNSFSIENRVIPNEGLKISLSVTFSNTEGLLREKFGYCDTKSFRRRIVTYPC